VLFNLYVIAEKKGENFDFQRFLKSEDVKELRVYGDYFFEEERWEEARQLYEKAEGKEHEVEVLLNLYIIAEKKGENFDFQNFLKSENFEELSQYVDFFKRHAIQFEDYVLRIPFYQDALRLRERQLTLDTTSILRIAVADEYNSLGFFQLFLADGKSAEISIIRSLALDPNNIYAPSNLAPALLLQGRIREAEIEYKKWKNKPFQEDSTYRDAFLQDLEEMEQAAVPGIDFALVRSWLQE